MVTYGKTIFGAAVVLILAETAPVRHTLPAQYDERAPSRRGVAPIRRRTAGVQAIAGRAEVRQNGSGADECTIEHAVVSAGLEIVLVRITGGGGFVDVNSEARLVI